MRLNNRFTVILLFVIGLLVVGSCAQKKNEKKYYTIEDAERDFLASITAEDTTAVLELADSFMQLAKDGNIDSALNMLYTINLNRATAHKITKEQRESIARHFERFPIFEYSISYYSFSTQANNDLKYEIEFTPRPDSETKGASIGFMLNPVKSAEGYWVLAVKDGLLPSKETKEQIHPKAPAPFYINVAK